MFNHILKEMRDKIRERKYVMTIHGEEEMSNDCLSIYDVESGILTGKIVERQKDRTTVEWKYRLIGKALDSREIEVIAKLSPTGKLVIITVYVP